MHAPKKTTTANHASTTDLLPSVHLTNTVRPYIDHIANPDRRAVHPMLLAA